MPDSTASTPTPKASSDGREIARTQSSKPAPGASTAFVVAINVRWQNRAKFFCGFNNPSQCSEDTACCKKAAVHFDNRV